MNKKYNACEIVLELLPLYIEHKTGEESNFFVESHLAKCQECQEIYRLMNADFSMQMEKVEIDNLPKEIKKKSKRKRIHFTPTAKRIAILIMGLIGYLCLMIGVMVYTFWYLTGV